MMWLKMDNKKILDEIYAKPDEPIEKSQPDFFELISEAEAMLMDRQQDEQDLIYYVAKLPDECRSAILFAYKNIQKIKPPPDPIKCRRMF